MNVHVLFLYVLRKNYANEKIKLKQENHDTRRCEYLKRIRAYSIPIIFALL